MDSNDSQKRKWMDDGFDVSNVTAYPISSSQKAAFLARLQKPPSQKELRELCGEIQHLIPCPSTQSKKKAKRTAGCLNTTASSAQARSSIDYWSRGAGVQPPAEAGGVQHAASPTETMNNVASQLQEAGSMVAKAATTLQLLYDSQNTAAAAVPEEVPPRQRAAKAETAAREALANEVAALYASVYKLMAAGVVLVVCGTSAVLKAGWKTLLRNEAPPSTAAPGQHKEHGEEHAAMSQPNNTSALPATAAPAKELWEIKQQPVAPFDGAWKETWADAALQKFHLLDLRSEFGAPLRPPPAIMIEILYLLYMACERHTKPKSQYVDTELKLQLKALCCDEALALKKDRRVALWMRNFRLYMAPLFDELACHALTKKSGVAKSRLPVYIDLPQRPPA